ncbi:hypothetical protein GF336_05870 [Candidatus Woesearchaeota archaeon]|nr:hypothetical protein [Candidatus Woesearchaeota archaeon]
MGEPMAKNKKTKNNKKTTKNNNKTKKGKKTSNNKFLISIIVIAAIAVIATLAVKYNNTEEISDKEIVSVDGNVITQNQLDREYSLFFFLTGYPEEYKQVLTKDIYLEQMINEHLILQDASENGFELSKEETDSKLEEIIEKSNVSDFGEDLTEAGYSREELSGYYNKQATIAAYINQSVVGNINVSNKEAYELYKANEAAFNSSFSESKEDIKQYIASEKQKQLVNGYVESLKMAAEIELLEEAQEEVEPSEPEDECLSQYGVGADAVVFYHANWCPHCQNMQPIVQQLIDEGYKFVWIETTEGVNTELSECFEDVIQGAVPQFICAGTKASQLGEMSKENLKEFADKCAA